MLGHPGEEHTDKTICQHLIWPKMSSDISNCVVTCHQCQVAKSHRKKYGHSPPKEPNVSPWRTLCADMTGPHTVEAQDGETCVLNAMTMADPATGWFKIAEVPDKRQVLLPLCWTALGSVDTPDQCDAFLTTVMSSQVRNSRNC